MPYKIIDLDKGFDDFVVDDIAGLQKYIADLEIENKTNIDELNTYDKIKNFLMDNYNIDVVLI